MVFTPPTNFTLFKQRRERLKEEIKAHYQGSKGIVLIGAGFESDRYAFRQESSFYYLTGIVEPAGMLCIYLDGPEVLYVPQFSTPRSQWTQVTVEGPNDAAKAGVDEVRYLGNKIPGYSCRSVFMQETYQTIMNDIKSYVVGNKAKVFTLLDMSREGYLSHINIYDSFMSLIPELCTATVDVSPLVHEMRRIKDEYEIDMMYKAIQLTNMAHTAAASLIEPGICEYELQAAIESVFMQVAAATPAFPSIVATGKNATVLHYTRRDAQLKVDDLVVIDIGAEYGLYAADLTRTYPVSKKFTPRQREIYQLVLDTQSYVESIAKPGMYLKNATYPEKSLHHLAVKFLESKGMAQYLYHGIGHYVGLDVHDVGDLSLPIEVGEVFTIEPGLYLSQENIGVRIEDNYVMADDGIVCLSYELPKQPTETEKLVAARL
jgi:Xaa-Pro aminopeptidase